MSKTTDGIKELIEYVNVGLREQKRMIESDVEANKDKLTKDNMDEKWEEWYHYADMLREAGNEMRKLLTRRLALKNALAIAENDK
jgi:hypothetical protein